MFRDVRECLDAGNRLHTLLASQKLPRKSIPILIDVEQGICNGSLRIFKNSIQQYIIFVYSFFLKILSIKALQALHDAPPLR